MYFSSTKFFFFSVIVAATAPFLGLVISLVGAFNISALAIIFPAVADFCVNWDGGKGGFCLVLRDAFLVLFGILGMISGSYASLYGIVFKIQEQSTEIKRHFHYVFD